MGYEQHDGATWDSTGDAVGGVQGTTYKIFLVGSHGGLVVEGVAGGTAIPVSGTFWQATQPVSGTVTADTEMPAAAALGDTDANPTTPTVGAAILGWTGSVWQRLKSGLSTQASAVGLLNNLPMVLRGDSSAYDVLRTPGGDTNSNIGWPGVGLLSWNTAGSGWDRVRTGVVGNIAAATGYLDSLLVAQYNATLPTITDTRYNNLQTDMNGKLRVVQGEWSYAHITTATTTVVKSGGGVIGGIYFNKRVATGVTTVEDATSDTTPVIGVVTLGAALLTDPPFNAWLSGVTFTVGLTVKTSQAEDITVAYK